MKVKVLFGISVMLLSAQMMTARTKNVVKNDTTTLNKKVPKEWYEKEHQLHDVTVVAHTPIVKMKTDKITYQVRHDVDAKTHTVLEMLRKVPMITVDGKNNISVNGSKQFKVYIDGRPSTMVTRNPTQILRNMPANSIESIEVTTNPGAQYDAEGAGGILNIITKKNKNLNNKIESINGTVHSTIGTNNYGLDANISGQKNHFSYDVNLMTDYMKYKHNKSESDINQKSFSAHTSQDTKQSMPFHMAEFGIGYQLDSLSSLHMNLSVTNFKLHEYGFPEYFYKGGTYGNGLKFGNNLDTRSNETSYDGSINYQRFFGKNNKGSMMFTYQLSHNPVKNDNVNSFFNINQTQLVIPESRKSSVREKNTEHNFLADFTIPLNKNTKINTGAKLTLGQNQSNSSDYRIDKGLYKENIDGSVFYKQKQQIMAMYGEYDATIGWLSVKPGLRYEYTLQKTKYLKGAGSNFNIHYGTIVPALSISARISELQNIGVNYNLRIRRPGITELDPYVDRSNPTTLVYGNSHLDAEKTNNLSIVYNLTASNFAMNATLRHSFSNNAIEQYSFNNNGVLNTTYGNIVKRNISALNLYMNWSMTTSTRMMLNAEAGYTDLRSAALNAKNNGWNLNVNYGIQQNMPWDIKLTTNLELMTRKHTLQGYESGMSLLSASISKSFCNDKWNVTVSGTTGLGHGGNIVWTSYNKGNDFNSTNSFTEPVKNISLGISYTFGSKKETNKDDDDWMQIGSKSHSGKHRK
ncbi:TonB-dependent receptor [Prevotella herbatica]|uniref:TonB-dependent receptor n=1 Tax=Prevotella herbatica TaxID=2801997 RepID=A0ABN6EKR9_9BACT|nr:outer membrane beta-barrel family protein [Prevotella herbatica]BCS84718.1 TonB-dependent receptor [Prevotella herbatica]